MALPVFKSDDQSLTLLQSAWGSQLNPVLGNPLVNGTLLRNVALASGSNTVNHKLGRKLQGWVITRQRSSGSVYDTQDSNQHPDLTLTLQASAAMVVDLYVF